jgi:hypothetical protein
MKYVIIKLADDLYQAHSKSVGFMLFGPSDNTLICQASTEEKCIKILKDHVNKIKHPYETVREIEL